MIDWSAVSAVCSGVIIPLIVLLVNKIGKQGITQNEYNELTLRGLQSIGDLSKASADAIQSNSSQECLDRLEQCQREYDGFRKDADKFTRKQAVRTL